VLKGPAPEHQQESHVRFRKGSKSWGKDYPKQGQFPCWYFFFQGAVVAYTNVGKYRLRDAEIYIILINFTKLLFVCLLVCLSSKLGVVVVVCLFVCLFCCFGLVFVCFCCCWFGLLLFG